MVYSHISIILCAFSQTLTSVNTRKHIHVMESASICPALSIAGVMMVPTEIPS
jgi:hypothetical protein